MNISRLLSGAWNTVKHLSGFEPKALAPSPTATVTDTFERVRGRQELGIISDLDFTVIPHGKSHHIDLAAPYRGIVSLYQALELQNGGTLGDTFYVTGREPLSASPIPGYLARYGLPKGPVETGYPFPAFVTQREKIRDIERIFAARQGQRFVLFGDTDQRDPEVYAEIRRRHPDQVAAIVMHRISDDVPAERVAGMILVDIYEAAAAALNQQGLLNSADAAKIISGGI